MGGPSSSRRWALKRNLPALIHAGDILKLHRLGEWVEPNVLEACEKAVESPSLLEPWESGMIHKQWKLLAESGKLRGIRSKTSPQSETD